MMDLSRNSNKLLRVQENDIERALRHYGLSRAVLEEGLESLRQWYKLQPHLPYGEMGDDKLIRHLLTNGFSIERTKKNIDAYFTARNIMPEFTSNRDPMSKHVEHIFRYCQVATLPERTASNHRVTILRVTDPDASLWNAWHAFKLAFMIGDYRLVNDAAIGEHYIVNFDNIRIGHLAQFTPSLVTKSLFYLQSCVGAKIKGIHLLGLPHYAETIVNMFKAALSKKISERFYTYSNLDELKAVFPAKILPKDMGGEDISMSEIMENWKQTLQSSEWRQWFKEQENVRADESRRDRSISNSCADDILGMNGSFRRLDLD